MKRKNSFSSTEASFDSLMENTEGENIRKGNFEENPNQNSSPIKKTNSTHCVTECDNESNYGESGFTEPRNDVTTLRMLFEKCRQSDLEFYESCLDGGLLNSLSSKCHACDVEADIIETTLSHIKEEEEETTPNVDSLSRQCPDCKDEWSIRRDSWCQNIKLSLKELVLVIYCWCRGFSETLTSHELDVDVNLVSEVFLKCSSVADDYFQNPLSNLGGSDKSVIADIFTYNNRRILGFMEKDSNNSFFSLLKTANSENEILTVLIDNLCEGTTISTKESSQLVEMLDEECLSYLKESWEISFDSQMNSTDALILQWTPYEHCLPPGNFIDPSFTEINVDSVLRLSLFKKRLENSNDSFLFFLTIVSHLYGSNS